MDFDSNVSKNREMIHNRMSSRQVVTRWFVAGGLVVGGLVGYLAADVNIVNEVLRNALHSPELVRSVAHMLSTTDVSTALAAIDGGARALLTLVGAGAVGKFTHFSMSGLARDAHEEDVRNAQNRTSSDAATRRVNAERINRERRSAKIEAQKNRIKNRGGR